MLRFRSSLREQCSIDIHRLVRATVQTTLSAYSAWLWHNLAKVATGNVQDSGFAVSQTLREDCPGKTCGKPGVEKT